MSDHTARSVRSVVRGRFAAPLAAAVLLVGTLVCGGLAVSAGWAGFKAKQCLDGRLQPDGDSISITEQGCEVTTTSGETLLVPISGPPFEVGVAGAVGFVVLGAATTAVLVKRVRRRT